MSTPDIPRVLDLWREGHSGTRIARMLGLPNRRHVERIVAHARDIGDKRAVLHSCAHTKHAAGHAVKAKRLLIENPEIKVVPLRPWTNRGDGKPSCSKGHAMTGVNLYVQPNGRRECRQCRRDRAQRRGGANK